MRKVFVYAGLIVLFNSCGNNSSNIEQSRTDDVASSENITVEDNKANLSEPEKESTKESKSCSSFALHVYLRDPDKSGTNIRKSPGGEILTKLIVDDKNFEYFLTLTEEKNGWYKIKGPIGSIENDVNLPDNEGWIHGSVLAVDTRNYGGQTIELIDNLEEGKVVGKIETESYELRIKGVCWDWIKVEYNGVIGWLESDWLCGNPLTNCS